eukprot:scaffold3323_cov30-Prasinocladus_malaysianus.AAC.2
MMIFTAANQGGLHLYSLDCLIPIIQCMHDAHVDIGLKQTRPATMAVMQMCYRVLQPIHPDVSRLLTWTW